MDYKAQPLTGAFPTEKECLFRVWSPIASSMQVILYPEEKILDMKQVEGGYWEISVPNIPVGTRYRFRRDGEAPLADPASRHQPEGVHGPSAVTNTEFPWTDEDWNGIPLEDMILYELHTGTFTPDGNFSGILQKLDYLQQLGINTIEIMPVSQFPGTRNWGYDGVFPYAVHDVYGGRKGLKELVNAAHARGMAVVLDVVYNHLGPEGNVFEKYGTYFTDKFKTPWGKAINFDDAFCDPVRAYFIQNALMWLDEFHIDGLRVDAVHALWDCGTRHIAQELHEAVQELENRSGKKKILIAEIDYNNPRYIRPVSEGGYGMNGQWVDEFHHALHSLVTGETNGYYADFGGTAQMEKTLRDSYVFTGEYSSVRKRFFGQSPADLPYDKFVVFTQNHDQTGNRLGGERLSALVQFDALKLCAAAMLLSAHVPMLFMGEEYGEKNPFLFFTDHSDPELIKNLREGRKTEFASFNWEGPIPDPQDPATFSQSTLGWNTEDLKSAELLRFYTWLIHVRKTHPAMQNRTRTGTRVYASLEKLVVFERNNNRHKLLVLLNFGNTVANTSNETGRHAKLLMDSSLDHWPVKQEEIIEPHASIHVSPFSVKVYESVPS